ncbi:MAG: MFS transporter [bacterium]|nr:MFS transporter [bacterium]
MEAQHVISMKAPLAEEGRLTKTFAYYTAFVALGLVTASLGTTLPGLAEQVRSGIGEMSFLFTARSLGYLLGALLGGRLYDRMAGHPIIALMLGGMAVMMACIPLASFLWVLVGALLLLGIAESIVDVGGNTLLVWVHRSEVGPFMNALHFFFGVGSFLSPLIVARVVAVNDDITWVYWILAILILPVALWFGFLASPKAQTSREQSYVKTGHPFLVAGVALFFFLYVGVEVGFGGWVFTYAVATDLADKTHAAYLTSAFWGALTLGRLLSIPFTGRFKPITLLFMTLTGGVASITLMLLRQDSFAILVTGALGLGFFLATIFPTTISFSERRMTISGKVTGMFFVGASLGAMTVPWIIGQLIESRGTHTMMPILLTAMSGALLVLILLATLSQRRGA